MPPLLFRRRAATPHSTPHLTVIQGTDVAEKAVLPAPIALPAKARAAGMPPLRPTMTLLNLTTIELVASPFLSFRDVGRFHETLAALPNVRAVHLRRLQGGALQVRVECKGATELLADLAAAYQPGFRIQSLYTHRVEIVLQTEAEIEEVAQGRWA